MNQMIRTYQQHTTSQKIPSFSATSSHISEQTKSTSRPVQLMIRNNITTIPYTTRESYHISRYPLLPPFISHQRANEAVRTTSNKGIIYPSDIPPPSLPPPPATSSHPHHGITAARRQQTRPKHKP
jgi:hypothetical protein